MENEHVLGWKSLNFLGHRSVLVLFLTILFHKNGLWSYPVRSFFCWYISPRQFVVFFSEVDLWRRRFSALGAPAAVLLALPPSSAKVWKRSGCVWRFFDVSYGRKSWIFAFSVFAIFRNFSAFSCASLQRRGFCPSRKHYALALRAFWMRCGRVG